MVREFKLVNEKGQSYSLMDIEKYCLLTEITGLGISYTTEYKKIGNTFVPNFKTLEQGKPSGIVNFKNYDNYGNFADFINMSEKLKILYKIPFKMGSKEYFRDVNIQALDKTEIKQNGILSEPIVFECLSLWYEENKTVYRIEPQEDELRWDFKWDSKFTDYSNRSLSYINKSHVEAPIEVAINGHVVNPSISLYVGGELVQKLKLNVEILEYEKLLYGTKENDFYINKQKVDGTLESLFSLEVLSDFQTVDEVIRIPINKSCEVKLEADNEVLNAEITVYPQYISV